MRRAVITGLGLWALAAVALAVALVNRTERIGELGGEGWTSYAPLSDVSIDRFDGLRAFDPVLWLGLAIGLALAGAIVLAFGTRGLGGAR